MSTRRRVTSMDDAIRVLSLGDRVPNGRYRVHSRFSTAVNLTDGRRLVSVVSSDVDAGPINVVVSRLDPEGLSELRVDGRDVELWGPAPRVCGNDAAGRDGSPAARSGGPTRTGGAWVSRVDDARIYRSELAFDPADAEVLAGNLTLLASLIGRLAPAGSLAFLLVPERRSELRRGFERELAEHIETCVRDIFHGDMVRGVTRIRGCGVGLTPSGDDFVSGLLVAMRLLELATARDLSEARTAVARAAVTGNSLSTTYLRLAAGGHVFESTRELISSLSLPDVRALRAAVERMVSVGSTSGADTAVGLCLGLRHGLDGWPGERGRRDLCQ